MEENVCVMVSDDNTGVVKKSTKRRPTDPLVGVKVQMPTLAAVQKQYNLMCRVWEKVNLPAADKKELYKTLVHLRKIVVKLKENKEIA